MDVPLQKITPSVKKTRKSRFTRSQKNLNFAKFLEDIIYIYIFN